MGEVVPGVSGRGERTGFTDGWRLKSPAPVVQTGKTLTKRRCCLRLIIHLNRRLSEARPPEQLLIHADLCLLLNLTLASAPQLDTHSKSRHTPYSLTQEL